MKISRIRSDSNGTLGDGGTTNANRPVLGVHSAPQSVTFGGLARRDLTATGPNTVTVVTPPHDPGAVDVVATAVLVVIVANGLNYPDALAAGPAGEVLGGPILLVTPSSMPSVIASELQQLKPAKIVVAGGPNSVLTALKTFTNAPVTRWSGADRYATAAAISAQTFAPGVDTAYIASGTNFPDALSGAPAAGFRHGPVLLTLPGALPASTITELTRLQPRKIVILGGSDTISNDVRTALGAYTTGSVSHAAGADRFDTSAAVSIKTFSSGVAVAYIANGTTFPDALSIAPVAGRQGGPVLLAQSNSLPSSIAAELTRLHPKCIVVVGGVNSISASLQQQLLTYLL